jgi:uncharacterized protein with PQ loop repeat
VEALQLFFSPVITHWLFDWVFAAVVMINPFAFAPQVWKAVTAPSTEGISLPMFGIFLAIQGIGALFGIKVANWAILVSVLICMVESATIIVVVLVRR